MITLLQEKIQFCTFSIKRHKKTKRNINKKGISNEKSVMCPKMKFKDLDKATFPTSSAKVGNKLKRTTQGKTVKSLHIL